MSRTVIDVPQFNAPRPRTIVIGVLAVVALLFLNGLWYMVPPESEAVRVRFGRVVEDGIKPGLHFKLPLGIESADIRPVQRQLKMEFGFATQGALNEFQSGIPGEQELVKNMVTGDLNAVLVEWVVHYRIDNLQDFIYKVRAPEGTLRDICESVVREIVGDRTVDEVLTVGRLEIEREAKIRIQEIATRYELGVVVDQMQLSGVNPPTPVRRSFDEVNRSQQEREQQINVAKGEYNKVVPRAKGEADQRLSEAEGDALKRVNEATGDADRFTALFTEYSRAPDVTRRRMYLETMTQILPNIGPKVVLDAAAPNVLPFLPIQPGAAVPPPAPGTGLSSSAPGVSGSSVRR